MPQAGNTMEEGTIVSWRVAEGDSIEVEDVRLDVLETPGHTPEHVSYVVTDTARAEKPACVLTGDTLFVGASTAALVAFDINTGTRLFSVRFPGQVDLNDVEADNSGNIYVSDPQGNQVHRLRLSDLSASTIVTGITMANGLLFDEENNRLLVCQWIEDSPISAIDLDDYSLTPVRNDGLHGKLFDTSKPLKNG